MCVCVQALDWIQDTGEVYLAAHTSPGDSSEETQQLLNDYHHFRLTAKVEQTCWSEHGSWCEEMVGLLPCRPFAVQMFLLIG